MAVRSSRSHFWECALHCDNGRAPDIEEEGTNGTRGKGGYVYRKGRKVRAGEWNDIIAFLSDFEKWAVMSSLSLHFLGIAEIRSPSQACHTSGRKTPSATSFLRLSFASSKRSVRGRQRVQMLKGQSQISNDMFSACRMVGVMDAVVSFQVDFCSAVC